MFIVNFGHLLASSSKGSMQEPKEYDEFGLEPGEAITDKRLEKKFHSAATFLQSVADKMSQEDLLYCYGRYKQATCGNAGVFLVKIKLEYCKKGLRQNPNKNPSLLSVTLCIRKNMKRSLTRIFIFSPWM